MDLKTPKGTIDYNPEDALLYESLIDKTKQIYKLHGAIPIDTPVFELKSILLNKYGEDTKLIYDLKDNGGEECALRYDLTVPFSRYMTMNKLKKIKRYQIGKVFRRDQPSVKQGRLREFIQSDFDIAGEGLPIMPDSELICCLNRLLKSFDIGKFVIRLSDKRVLFGIFQVCEIPPNLFATVSSSVDKMDKMSIDDINKELKTKGLNDEQINNLNLYIKKSGKEDILDFLASSKVYEICKEAIDELSILLRYCKIMNCEENLLIDLSLARGLDYYTGMILEGRYIGHDMGSVAGGGRYDNLIGTKQSKVPCAGFSIGLTRIFYLIKNRNVNSSVDVFISSSGKIFLEERLRIQNILWDANIKVETFYTKRANVAEHKKYCQKKNIKFLIVLGENELEQDSVILINIETEEKEVVQVETLQSLLKSK
ncbi:histidine-tRNA ligase (HARS1) [Vairimorpha necatrix]|uniref:histidine--tRNA ligase n=1 Tax=Vairimorpha necatrix TaxID=6039 RepID=A0AAX4J7T8_9MICR